MRMIIYFFSMSAYMRRLRRCMRMTKVIARLNSTTTPINPPTIPASDIVVVCVTTADWLVACANPAVLGVICVSKAAANKLQWTYDVPKISLSITVSATLVTNAVGTAVTVESTLVSVTNASPDVLVSTTVSAVVTEVRTVVEKTNDIVAECRV
jgi:hypothetical protein